MEASDIIYCIGDSHVSFFSGYDQIQPVYPEKANNKFPFFKSFRLGAVLAYSLNKFDTRERGREKLLQLIESLPAKAKILLCFGEIDCRYHLLKQAESQRLQLNEIVENCVNTYFQVVDELLSQGFEVMVWNVVATSNGHNVDYPFYGTHEERNNCTLIFNRKIEVNCKLRGIFYLSIFKRLVSKKLVTRSIYYFDSIHLGQLAMPYVLNELVKFKSTSLDSIGRYEVYFGMTRSVVYRFFKLVIRNTKRILKK